VEQDKDRREDQVRDDSRTANDEVEDNDEEPFVQHNGSVVSTVLYSIVEKVDGALLL